MNNLEKRKRQSGYKEDEGINSKDDAAKKKIQFKM